MRPPAALVLTALLAWPLGAGAEGPEPPGAVTRNGRVVRLVDADGAVHYTNEPCQPRYVRLAGEACPSPVAAVIVEQSTRSGPPGRGEAALRRESSPAATTPDTLDRRIETLAARHGVDPRLVDAVIRVESGGDPGAISPKGAMGLMQLMPTRAAALGVRDAFDPGESLEGGIRHLRELLTRHGGNVPLALAAYNAGEDAVRRYGGIPPYRETQEYVRKVLARYYGGRARPTRRATSSP